MSWQLRADVDYNSLHEILNKSFFFICRNVDFGDILTEENRAKHKHTRYNLIANVVHDGEPNKGTYRVHILQKSTGQWYEMQDLHVTNILPQMITLTESYIQIYELQTDAEQMEHWVKGLNSISWNLMDILFNCESFKIKATKISLFFVWNKKFISFFESVYMQWYKLGKVL